MHEQIHLLQELRRLDSAIAALRTGLQATEGDLQRTESEERLMAEALEREKAKLEASRQKRRAAEVEVGGCNDRKNQFQNQLNVVKNNTEYQALLREIAAAEKRAREWEDVILEAMEEEESGQAKIAKLESDVRGKREISGGERQRLQQQREAADQEIATLTARRDDVLARMEPQVRRKYERLRQARGEVVIVPIVNGACGGCHFRLPPQVVNQVRQGEAMLFCESCGRMLVFDKQAADQA